jgi:hypothetical protein
MKLRHAAALALVAWYLMTPVAARCVEHANGKWSLRVPPNIKTGHGPEIDFTAPLNHWWSIGGGFRSREACERARANWPTDTWTGQQVLHGKCVLIDDPRLKSK